MPGPQEAFDAPLGKAEPSCVLDSTAPGTLCIGPVVGLAQTIGRARSDRKIAALL